MKSWRQYLKSREEVLDFARDNVWLLVIVAVLLVNTVVAYWVFARPRPEQPSNQPPAVVETTPKFISALTGEPLLDAEARPLAVMIDNYVAARPSSGLNEASVVWETLVEGGVTRLLAIFTTSADTAIGPVRSAREYYLPWASELGALYAHSGGSPLALSALAAGVPNVNDANEFFNGQYFQRARALPAPHDLVTTTNKLRQLALAKGWTSTWQITPWAVGKDVPPNGEAAINITLNFLGDDRYQVKWHYDVNTQHYVRVQGGSPALDRETKQQLNSLNVVVLLAQVVAAPRPGVPDAISVKTIGSGEALLFRDGQVFKGKWSKDSTTDRTIITQQDGSPLPITPGRVWIEVVPNSPASVNYTP